MDGTNNYQPIAGVEIQKIAEDLVASALRECHNAYNMGFCRGIATVIVVGGAGADISQEAAKNVMKALGPHLSPDMQAEVARVIKELTLMLQCQLAKGEPN